MPSLLPSLQAPLSLIVGLVQCGIVGKNDGLGFLEMTAQSAMVTNKEEVALVEPFLKHLIYPSSPIRVTIN